MEIEKNGDSILVEAEKLIQNSCSRFAFDDAIKLFRHAEYTYELSENFQKANDVCKRIALLYLDAKLPNYAINHLNICLKYEFDQELFELFYKHGFESKRYFQVATYIHELASCEKDLEKQYNHLKMAHNLYTENNYEFESRENRNCTIDLMVTCLKLQKLDECKELLKDILLICPDEFLPHFEQIIDYLETNEMNDIVSNILSNEEV